MKNIFETSIAFWRSAVLFYALKLNLFEKLGENPSTEREIALLCGIEEKKMKRILRALSAMKLLHRNCEQYFCSSEIAEQLIPGRGKNLSHFSRAMGEDFSAGFWVDLNGIKKNKTIEAPIIVNDSPVSPQNLTLAQQDIAIMGEAKALAEKVNLCDRKKLIDFGGGSGIYSIMLCKRNPHLQALILELPQIASLTKKIVQEYELDERIEVHALNWGESHFKEEYDVALLSDVLYFPESECQNLLRISADALTDGGLMVIRGYFLDDGDERIFPALFNVNLMLSNENYGAYEVKTVENWLSDLRLREIESQILSEISYLITAKKIKNQKSAKV
jgi:hypothetical protein